jgi:hypothetical protein
MHRPILLVLLVITLTAPGAVAQRQEKTTGIFTNMQLSKETGDVSGMEFFIGYEWVLFQDAEGSVPQPVLVDAKQEGNHVSFDLPSSFPFLRHFDGEVRGDRLIGQFTRDGAEPIAVNLKRQNSFWQ